jgi:hypothetical protein
MICGCPVFLWLFRMLLRLFSKVFDLLFKLFSAFLDGLDR